MQTMWAVGGVANTFGCSSTCKSSPSVRRDSSKNGENAVIKLRKISCICSPSKAISRDPDEEKGIKKQRINSIFQDFSVLIHSLLRGSSVHCDDIHCQMKQIFWRGCQHARVQYLQVNWQLQRRQKVMVGFRKHSIYHFMSLRRKAAFN